MILANSLSVTTQPGFDESQRHIVSATGVSNSVRAALNASLKIPQDLSAFDAAMEFSYWMFANLREDGKQMPSWLYGC